MAGDGSDGGGGEDEAVARGNTKEEAEAGWIKSDVYSWPNLVVPNTEELISRPFVDKN